MSAARCWNRTTSPAWALPPTRCARVSIRKTSSLTSSIATSTTRTSATWFARSARSTVVPAHPTPTCAPSTRSPKRSMRRSRCAPPEIHNLHLISKLDYETIMGRLKEAGLYSLPGGGAEILDDEVRKRVATKCTTDEWLAVMRAVHHVGLRSTATMMFGIGDTVEHRVRHLQRIRDLQDETGGFTAFIPWTFQRENTALGRKIKDEPTGMDYLKMLAVSRLFLDNIENFQSSWLTQGLRLGQVALRFGANDMGSIMIEENVVSAAGAHNRADEKMLRYLITEAGFIPQQRDILYEYVTRQTALPQNSVVNAA